MCQQTKLNTWNYRITLVNLLYSVLSIYLSPIYISGIVAHDRCNISQSFTFFVQFQCAMLCCAFHLHNCFSEGSKTGQRGRKVGGQGCWVIVIYFKVLDCLISVNVWTFFLLVHNEIYYHCYQYLHYHYYYYYYYGCFFYLFSLIGSFYFQINCFYILRFSNFTLESLSKIHEKCGKWEFALRKVSDNNLKMFLTVSSKKHIFMRFTHLRHFYYDELVLITLH